MELEQSHIDLLKRGFAELKSKNDLAALLSIAGKILDGKNFNPIPLSTLCYYANPNLSKKRYQSFEIKKKSGSLRIINAPTKRLKTILQSLNLIFQCVYEPQNFATGFVKGLSIVDNANVHIGNRYVYNLDLKDFFHSFDRNRVKMGLLYDPIYMGKEKENIAFFIACLCTHPFEVDGIIKTVLPQGSPTSPILTNILCKKLDRRLKGLANRFGANYTRYADDITFSSTHNIYKDIIFKNELKRIIEDDQNLFINPTKTRLQKVGTRQEVTGLIVNEKTNVQRKYIKQIRMWLYYWEKYGYEKAEQIFRRDYINEKGHVKNINARLKKVLDGKLEFLRMVKGSDDSTYNGLKERLNELSWMKEKKDTEKIDLESVLNTILSKGLDEGINLYTRFKNN